MSRESPYIIVEKRLIRSAAWRSLGKTAKDVYFLLRCRCVMVKMCGRRREKRSGPYGSYNIANNGEIVFPYAEAKSQFSITAGRFTRAIDELIAAGFVDVAATGMGVHKVATYYALTQRWRYYGTPDFEAATRPKPSIRNPGFKPRNELWRRGRQKKTSAKNEHGAVRENEHGAILAMRTNAHGEKLRICYKLRNDQWISCKIA